MEVHIAKYKDSAELMKTHDNRVGVTMTDVSDAKVLIKTICSPSDDTLDLIYYILRYLRNACVDCMKNQNFIIDSGFLEAYEDKLLNNLLNPDFNNECHEKGLTEMLVKSKLMAVQFLGNLVVRNEKTKKAVWKVGFPSLFFNLFTNLDNPSKDCLCMVIYNCLKDRKTLCENTDELGLLVSVIEFTREYNEAEWSLLILELLVSSKDFVSVYQQLDTYSSIRSTLLEIMSGHLEDDRSTCKVLEETLLFIANTFETKSTCILMLAKEVTDELLEESLNLVRMLSVLCTVTAYHDKYLKLRSKESLLKSTIVLLQQMCLIDATIPPEQLQKTHSTNCDNPIFGFRRDLVRLVGNLCYHNKLMQDKTREFDGINPILNSCNIDDKNPFMLQWAIFAIRNLCDNNEKNQECIRKLEKQGLADNKFLQKLDIKTKIVNGKVTLSSSDNKYKE